MLLFTIVLLFFGIILLRYVDKGQAGSYRYYVDEYERALLLKKITGLEKELTITDEDEQIFEMKQVVINELIRIKQKEKTKRIIRNRYKASKTIGFMYGGL